MPMPVATLTSMSATADIVSAPGYVKSIYKGMPVSCVGDSVSGANIVGVISSTSAINKLYGGKPVVVLTSMITGSNPITGVPLSMPVAQSMVLTTLK